MLSMNSDAPQQKFPWEGKPEEQHPKHLLFISIDIIDSTELKTESQKRKDKKSVWAKKLTNFLPYAPVLLVDNFNKALKQCPKIKNCPSQCLIENAKNSPQIDVWKYIGDEVVLTSELKCLTHAYLLIKALQETLTTLNDEKAQAKKSGKTIIVKFKSTAWVAGFPMQNIEILLPGNQGEIKDYIGPSVDLGFRLSKHATERKIILSSSLVYLLVKGAFDLEKQFPIYSGGNIPLKGVENGHHPLFWVLPSGQKEPHDEIHYAPSQMEKIKPFLQAFFKGKIPPFILADEQPSDEYCKKYSKTVTELSSLPCSIFFNRGEARTGKKIEVSQSENEGIDSILESVSEKVTVSTKK